MTFGRSFTLQSLASSPAEPSVAMAFAIIVSVVPFSLPGWLVSLICPKALGQLFICGV